MSPTLLNWLLGVGGPLFGLFISLYVKDAAVKAVKNEMVSAFAVFKGELLQQLDGTYVRTSICTLKMESMHDRVDVNAKQLDSQNATIMGLHNRLRHQQQGGD